MTGMYNVVEKLRSGEPLTEKERKVHEIAACGLRDLHDELDRVVADAYGWPWPMETDEILARLVAFHDERVEEEQRGLVRWLRPDYQIPRFGNRVEGDLALDDAPAEPDDDTPTDLPDWPDDPIEQLTGLRTVVAEKPRTVDQAARLFHSCSAREKSS
jgi:hypothetical protein